MLSSTSNPSVDEQQDAAVATINVAKTKEDDVMAVAQTATATAHWEQEALVTTVDATCKTLDNAQVHERAAILAWETEKTITHHLKQQLIVAQGIVIPQDDDDDRSINAGFNPDAALTTHLHM
jgi:hypothetical protein